MKNLILISLLFLAACINQDRPAVDKSYIPIDTALKMLETNKDAALKSAHDYGQEIFYNYNFLDTAGNSREYYIKYDFREVLGVEYFHVRTYRDGQNLSQGPMDTNAIYSFRAMPFPHDGVIMSDSETIELYKILEYKYPELFINN